MTRTSARRSAARSPSATGGSARRARPARTTWGCPGTGRFSCPPRSWRARYRPDRWPGRCRPRTGWNCTGCQGSEADMLEAHGLRYVRDGQLILAGLDVTVGPGESLAVTGPSGSGKTSLLAILSGLTAPTAGEVLIDGTRLTGFAGPARGVAVVLQGYGLVSLLTAAENVEVALRAVGRPPAAARAALADVGLDGHADQLVEELSGGQQQRVAVARALALTPHLLIVDEPTAELDPASRAVVLARIFGVTAHGGALVMATHEPEVAERCDRILDLRVAVGSP